MAMEKPEAVCFENLLFYILFLPLTIEIAKSLQKYIYFFLNP